MKPIRIIIADDHALVRVGLATLLQFHKDLQVVGEAKNGEEAITLARKLRPDVIVMDLMMPVMDGLEATRHIHAELPEIRILILTSFGTSADVAHAINAGATGAIMKDSPNDELIRAIRIVATGKAIYSSEIRKMILDNPTPPELTSRQAEVLEAIMRGLTNIDIGKQLSISPDAVKQHLNAICEKLGAANRTEAVAIALRKQLLKI